MRVYIIYVQIFVHAHMHACINLIFFHILFFIAFCAFFCINLLRAHARTRTAGAPVAGFISFLFLFSWQVLPSADSSHIDSAFSIFLFSIFFWQVLPSGDSSHIDSAFSTCSLPAHTDGNYWRDPPGLQVCMCVCVYVCMCVVSVCGS